VRKRLLILLAVLGLGAVALAAALGSAFGNGVIPTGEHTAGFFRFFAWSSGPRAFGALRFVEASPNQVLNVVELPAVQRAEFSGNSVVFRGPGTLNRHRVLVVVRAVDNRGPNHPGDPDEFQITCFRENQIVYQRQGPVVHGDIAVFTRP
jgi:hypothetical protein